MVDYYIDKMKSRLIELSFEVLLSKTASTFLLPATSYLNHIFTESAHWRKREFTKNRRSPRYLRLQQEFKTKCSKSKKDFFRKMTQQVKEANPSRWYSILKRISNYDPEKHEDLRHKSSVQSRAG